MIDRSQDNVVRGNVVRGNGPFSGISLVRKAAGNEVLGNTVADNDMSDFEYADAGRQTMGIRIEGPSANRNRIIGNTATGSGCDGIVVLATCDNPDDEPPCVGTPPNEHNDIAGNTCSGNGTSGRGCGIRLFSMPLPMPPAHNVVRDNVADDNTSYGIASTDCRCGRWATRPSGTGAGATGSSTAPMARSCHRVAATSGTATISRPSTSHACRNGTTTADPMGPACPGSKSSTAWCSTSGPGWKASPARPSPCRSTPALLDRILGLAGRDPGPGPPR